MGTVAGKYLKRTEISNTGKQYRILVLHTFNSCSIDFIGIIGALVRDSSKSAHSLSLSNQCIKVSFGHPTPQNSRLMTTNFVINF